MANNVVIKGKEYDRDEIDSKFVSGMTNAEISDRTSEKKIYTRTKGWVKESEFKQHVFGERQGRRVNSDGFLAIPPSVESAYECECGFSGLFKAESCAKCGAKLS